VASAAAFRLLRRRPSEGVGSAGRWTRFQTGSPSSASWILVAWVGFLLLGAFFAGAAVGLLGVRSAIPVVVAGVLAATSSSSTRAAKLFSFSMSLCERRDGATEAALALLVRLGSGRGATASGMTNSGSSSSAASTTSGSSIACKEFFVKQIL
jgi:hypothetical protein